jgi:murein L,D-transpeptidase YcbB/YkuD
MTAMRAALLALAAIANVFACSPAPGGAWTSGDLDELAAVAAGADGEGLRVETAQIEAIATLRAREAEAPDAAVTAELDRRADTLFLALAHDFALGHADPARADPTWRLPRPQVDLAALRADALAEGRVAEKLRALLPASAEYAALKAELARAESEEAAGAKDRVPALRANLERLRWMARDMPASRVEVRIPFYQLRRYADGAVVEEHKIIVGKRSTPTPSFATAIEAITLNPYWNPPSGIARNEIIPSLRRDPGAAARLNYQILDKSGALVDPRHVDWGAPFPYSIRQAPGPANALGQIKFEMPNPYAVYIHDTPAKTLFAQDARSFSHGCIRVEAPRDLAAALAPPEVAGSLADLIATGENRTIALAAPVPVYVIYMTTALGPDGTVIYAQDIYKRDEKIVRALDQPARSGEDIRLTALPVEGCAAG